MGIGVLGQIQVAPSWENDPVWRNNGENGREGRGGCGHHPPPPGRKIGGGRRRVDWVNKSSSLCNN